MSKELDFKEARKWATKHYLDHNLRININPKTKKFIIVDKNYKYWKFSATPKEFMDYSNPEKALNAIAKKRLLPLHLGQNKIYQNTFQLLESIDTEIKSQISKNLKKQL